MRVFLTGASGYLGSLLVEHLARLPEVESITGIGLAAPTAQPPAKMKFLHMDICSPELAVAMAGHDVVIHAAFVVLWPASMPVRVRDGTNFDGVRNVAEAARANKVRRFIHASSMAAYDPALACGQSDITEDFPLGHGKSRFYYWNAKASAEKVLNETFRSSPTVLSLFRPIYIIGPHNPWVVKSYRQNAVNFLGRDPRRQFIHETDVAAAFVQAVQTDMPGPFNVVPDDFVRLGELWQIVGARRTPTVPLWLARWITWIRWRFFGSPVHPCWVEDMLVDFTASNARLKATGWKPRYSSVQAIKSAL